MPTRRRRLSLRLTQKPENEIPIFRVRLSLVHRVIPSSGVSAKWFRENADRRALANAPVSFLLSPHFPENPTMNLRTIAVLLGSTLGATASPAVALQCGQVESSTIVASDAGPHENFGRALEMSEDWIAVGAKQNGVPDPDGMVYLYARGAVLQEIRIDPPAAALGGDFGEALDVDGDFLVVGEPDFDLHRGRVHVYRYDGALWSLQQTLEGAMGIDARYGMSVCLDAAAGRLAVGVPVVNSVEIYKLELGTWQHEQRIRPLVDGGTGWDISLQGNQIALGAPEDAGDRGAVYLYELEGAHWSFAKKIVHPETDAEDHFGCSVDLEGNEILIGCRQYEIGPLETGSAFMYEKSGSDWVLSETFHLPVAEEFAQMGFGVARDGNVALVSCQYGIAPSGDRGIVLQYRKQGDDWILQQSLYRRPPGFSSNFGGRVAVHGNTALAADITGTGLAHMSGTVKVFELPDLSLGITNDTPNLGEPFFVDACGGAPGNPGMVFLVGVNGVPVFVNLFPASFDNSGSFGFLGAYGPGLAGLLLDLQIFGVDGSGKVRASNVASLDFQ